MYADEFLSCVFSPLLIQVLANQLKYYPEESNQENNIDADVSNDARIVSPSVSSTADNDE